MAGRITADIELRTMPNGTSVATVPIATNRNYTDKQTGQKVEQVTWLRLTAFGKTAEIIKQYFVKGQVIYAECRINNRNWEKDNIKHYDFSFIIEKFEFGAKPQGSSGNFSPSGAPSGQNTAPSDDYADQVNDVPVDMGGDQDINVEDIPF